MVFVSASSWKLQTRFAGRACQILIDSRPFPSFSFVYEMRQDETRDLLRFVDWYFVCRYVGGPRWSITSFGAWGPIQTQLLKPETYLFPRTQAKICRKRWRVSVFPSQNNTEKQKQLMCLGKNKVPRWDTRMCQDVSRLHFPLQNSSKLQNELSRISGRPMSWLWWRRWGPDQTTSRWRTGRHLVAQEIVANAVGSRWKAKSEAKKVKKSNRIQHPIPSHPKPQIEQIWTSWDGWRDLPGKRFRMDSAWILHGFWQGMSRYKKRKKWGCIGSIRFLSVSCSAIRAVFARQGFHVFGVTVPDCGKQQRPMRGKCNGRVRAIGRSKKGRGCIVAVVNDWELRKSAKAAGRNKFKSSASQACN